LLENISIFFIQGSNTIYCAINKHNSQDVLGKLSDGSIFIMHPPHSSTQGKLYYLSYLSIIKFVSTIYYSKNEIFKSSAKMLNRQYIKSYQGSLKSYLYMLIYKYERWKVENLILEFIKL
jgi:hypothetical protein